MDNMRFVRYYTLAKHRFPLSIKNYGNLKLG